jgi:hypothetical protein
VRVRVSVCVRRESRVRMMLIDRVGAVTTAWGGVCTARRSTHPLVLELVLRLLGVGDDVLGGLEDVVVYGGGRSHPCRVQTVEEGQGVGLGLEQGCGGGGGAGTAQINCNCKQTDGLKQKPAPAVTTA